MYVQTYFGKSIVIGTSESFKSFGAHFTHSVSSEQMGAKTYCNFLNNGAVVFFARIK